MNLYRWRQRLRIALHRFQKRTLSRAKLRWKRFHRISVAKDEYLRLRTDEDFVNSIQLSRLVNAIRAAQRNYLRIPDNGNMANTRDRIEYQYYYASLVYEATKSLLDLGGKLKHLRAWQDNAPLIKELHRERNGADTYFTKVLAVIRNTVIFHFDKDAVDQAIGAFPVSDRMDLMIAETRMNRDMATPLAQNLVLNYVLSKDEGPRTGGEKYDEMLRYVTGLSTNVVHVANGCIIEVWVRNAHKTYERLDQ